jgi:4-hydroxy-tetrahydrodipicolinate synthase
MPPELTVPTSTPFGRVLTAMVTPFTDDLELDLDGAAALASSLVDQGNDGLVVSGTTGEAPTTSRQEKYELLRAVVDAVGDRAHVVAGVGSYDTAQTVELAEDAAKAGATGLLSVTPYYSRPSEAGLLAHYARSTSATDLPVMLYDIPARTGLALSHRLLLRLGELPQVVAVKDAKDDVAATGRLLAESDLAVYCGTDALNLPLLSLGAVGFVSVVSHVVTPQLVELLEAYDRGDVARAREVNRQLQPVYDGMFRAPGAVLAKAALALVGRPVGPLRLPHVAADAQQVEQLRRDLAGLLTPAGAR